MKPKLAMRCHKFGSKRFSLNAGQRTWPKHFKPLAGDEVLTSPAAMRGCLIWLGALRTRETLSYPTHPLFTTAKAHLEHN
jgi:hypothetical protein